jgi:hypothetical protein
MLNRGAWRSRAIFKREPKESIPNRLAHIGAIFCEDRIDGSVKTVLAMSGMSRSSPRDALHKGLQAAVDAVGSKAELRRRINALTDRPLSDAAICQWCNIPLDRVTDVFRATRVPKHVLRPDQHDAPDHFDRPSPESEALIEVLERLRSDALTATTIGERLLPRRRAAMAGE